MSESEPGTQVELLRRLETGNDPQLGTSEKETCITAPNDVDTIRIHSDIRTHIDWILSLPEDDITVLGYRTVSSQLYP